LIVQARKAAATAQKESLDLQRKKASMVARYLKKDGKKEGLDDAESKLVAAVHEIFKGKSCSSSLFCLAVDELTVPGPLSLAEKLDKVKAEKAVEKKKVRLCDRRRHISTRRLAPH
jgi:hypothetical protein